MKSINRGFSLIELMIVIAIIGILAAIAIPSYQTYVKKAKMSKVIQALSSYQTEIADYYNANGQLPPNLHDLPGAHYLNPSIFSSTDVVNVVWFSIEPPVNSMVKGFLGARVSDELGGGAVSIVPLGYEDGSIVFSCGFWDSTFIYQANSLPYMPVACSETDQGNL